MCVCVCVYICNMLTCIMLQDENGFTALMHSAKDGSEKITGRASVSLSKARVSRKFKKFKKLKIPKI